MEKAAEFSIDMLQDPKAFAIGRLPARTFFDALQTGEDGNLRSSKVLDLNGKWKFSYSENYDGAEVGFEKNDYDCSSWAEINVPGHMQLQGYDRPHYANAPYPWDGKENLKTGQVPSKFNPVGEYVKYFDKPVAPEGYRFRIYFGGIESGAAIWLNGKFVGYKEDSFDAGEYDITDMLTGGENKLAVQVFKWTLGSWFEDQDFFRFSGIFRSVWIYSVPPMHLEDFSVRTILDDEYKDAVLRVALKTTATGSAGLTLTDADGTVIFERNEQIETQSLFDTDVKAPALWSAEKPNLYTLRIQISDEQGRISETVEQAVGFRRFEMKDGIMCINGKRIVFRGVNRHEFCSDGGRVVPEEYTVRDIMTMKANNVNAIRTSHYPNDQILYDLCDKYGLYMIAENNMETHGTWCNPEVRLHSELALPSDHMEYEDMLLDRVRSCYEIHKNHPSIVIWSVGNESFGGDVIADMADEFRRLDHDRLVHYEGVFNDRRRNDSSDMESQMYTSAANTVKFLAEHPEKPMILCEYTHAMGNSCGGMSLYTDLTKTEPRFQGGFIWDYIDQSLDAVDEYGKEYQAYGGDFDDRPTEYNFSGNGIAYGDRSPSPKMQEVKFNYQPVDLLTCRDSVKIINYNLFTGTDEYETRLTVLKDGEVIKTFILKTAVAPLEEKTYSLPTYDTAEPGEYVNIVSLHSLTDTDYAPKGYEVAFGQYAYRVEGEAYATEKVPFEIIKGDQHAGIKGADFFALISPAQGGIASYVHGGREYIKIIPMPNFWRAPVDNDRGNTMPQRYAQWKIASMYVTNKQNGNFDVLIPAIEPREDGLETEFTFKLPTSPEANVVVKYMIHGDGTIDTTLSYDAVPELHDMPEFGMMFVLSSKLENVRWYGLGPDETYADRKCGGKLGIWSNKVADNMAKYLRPQECGNKEEVRWGEVSDNDGHGIRFTSLGAPMCFSALPYTPHEMELAYHPNELPPVHHTVVRVSLGQMGVAGDDSWGSRTLPQYLLKAEGHMEFKFSWKAF